MRTIRLLPTERQEGKNVTGCMLSIVIDPSRSVARAWMMGEAVRVLSA